MKKQTRKIANLGTIDFSKIELMDSIEMYINIAELSDDLKEEVEKAVEIGKLLFAKKRESYMNIRNYHWCKSGVKTTPQLHISLEADRKIQYELYVFFEDLENKDLCDSVSIEVDLSEHMQELKRIIFHVLVDKFI